MRAPPPATGVNLGWIAAELAAPKIAAPIGFAHRMRLASALHSHAGSALVATGANRSSRSKASWNSDWLIERARAPDSAPAPPAS
jgi:hypothetical protein